MKAIHLDSSNFDSTLAGTTLPVLVDFHAEWCGPCKMLGPVIEQVAAAKAGEAIVAKVDIDARNLMAKPAPKAKVIEITPDAAATTPAKSVVLGR